MHLKTKSSMKLTATHSPNSGVSEMVGTTVSHHPNLNQIRLNAQPVWRLFTIYDTSDPIENPHPPTKSRLRRHTSWEMETYPSDIEQNCSDHVN